MRVIGSRGKLSVNANRWAHHNQVGFETTMKNLPKTNNSPVLRTDFSDNSAWKSICAAILQPVGEFRAYVDFIDDSTFNDIAVKQLLSLIPSDANPGFIFVVDHTTLSKPDYPILVVDLFTEIGRTFRVIPSEM